MSTRKKIQASYLNRMNFFERKFSPVIAKAIQSQIKAFVKDMKANGLDHAKRNLDRIVINAEVHKAVLSIYKTVGVFFANDKYRQITEQVKTRKKSAWLELETKAFGFNQEWVDALVNYFKEFLLNKAVIPISETTREQIRQILIIGEQQGWGIDEIAQKLVQSELTLMRARLIVRTETAKAAFKGRELAKEKQPYKLNSEWIAANDHRTRHSHRLVDGVVIPDGGTFSVPRYKKIGKVDVQVGVDLMKGPGDPQAHKENVINCRCTTNERVVFDNEDNPIMKNQYALA